MSDPASVEARRSLTRLGHAFTVTDDLMQGIEKFVCQLYGSSEHSSINDLRYNMFCLKAAQSSQLPPCQDALSLHVSRANYQAAIWRCSLLARPDVPSPMQHGWQLVDGELRIHWMTQQPAPAELLELVSCGCKTGCVSRRCSCSKASLPCTPACSCSNCDNHQVEEGDEPETTSDVGADSESECSGEDGQLLD